ncbi:hypothetical protein [Fusibacillus kribbianus]|uniref:Uncharacterized protein n=1 Tax=Fusibacillus kribbianus TaxID=3044208 RepID=A0AAP4BC39_9FIRM|nr:hypothetical protein [Ruminococcus sp. YH-rum2234]MDI9241911.1 hypothetical protein [Ruminococcus sp. YH-rum2234]
MTKEEWIKQYGCVEEDLELSEEDIDITIDLSEVDDECLRRTES